MTRQADLISIGIITGAHGVRGQVKIKHFLDNPKSILSNAAVYGADGKKQYTLTLHSATDQMLIASIQGISDRNQAELLRKTELFIRKEALPEIKGDGWYYNDLIGLDARLKNGSVYGQVIGVYNFGAGDIIELKKIDDSEEMLPFEIGKSVV